MIEVARNVGISESCLRRWMAQDAVDTGAADGITTAQVREVADGLLASVAAHDAPFDQATAERWLDLLARVRR